MTYLLTLRASFSFSWVIWLLNFIETRHASFDTSDIRNHIEITQSAMPKPGYLLTCRRLTRSTTPWLIKYGPKYEQIDSGKYGAVGTQTFNAEACELANLLAHVSQLCQKMNLLTPKELYRPIFFKHWRHFSDQNSYTRQAVWLGYGGCSFVCRYLRITGLLSAPLVLRIGDWLCLLPAITLVVW